MDYTRNDLEQIIIGTLLNENIGDNIYIDNKKVLCKELFKDKRNIFIFDIIKKMRNEGDCRTFPYDILLYTDKNSIRYGNLTNFCLYMCELSYKYNEYKRFKEYIKELVSYYVKEQRNEKKQ